MRIVNWTANGSFSSKEPQYIPQNARTLSLGNSQIHHTLCCLPRGVFKGTLNLKPGTLNPKLGTLNPKPADLTLNPEP